MTNDGSAAATPRWLISLFVTALGLWIGAAAFVSAGVLPVLFLNLEVAEAGRIAALIFPVYFRASLVLGVIASVAAFAISRSAGRPWLYAFAVLVVMTLAQAWTTLSIHPEMALIRGVNDAVVRFQDLHKLSVRLNSVVLGGGALLLLSSGWLLAARGGRRHD